MTELILITEFLHKKRHDHKIFMAAISWCGAKLRMTSGLEAYEAYCAATETMIAFRKRYVLLLSLLVVIFNRKRQTDFYAQ